MHYLARCSLSELNTLWEWGDLSISESNLRPPLIWYVESSVVKNIDISINIDTEISERYQY